jgi:hypothetical protein
VDQYRGVGIESANTRKPMSPTTAREQPAQGRDRQGVGEARAEAGGERAPGHDSRDCGRPHAPRHKPAIRARGSGSPAPDAESFMTPADTLFAGHAFVVLYFVPGRAE